jgi:hypothetical protein
MRARHRGGSRDGGRGLGDGRLRGGDLLEVVHVQHVVVAARVRHVLDGDLGGDLLVEARLHGLLCLRYGLGLCCGGRFALCGVGNLRSGARVGGFHDQVEVRRVPR